VPAFSLALVANLGCDFSLKTGQGDEPLQTGDSDAPLDPPGQPEGDGLACEAHDDCPEGLACVDGVCADVGGVGDNEPLACNVDADCPDDQLCFDGACTG